MRLDGALCRRGLGVVPEHLARLPAHEGLQVATGEPPANDNGYLLELTSHPGMALSVGPYEDRDDVKKLILVPAAEAERFIVAADHLRLVNGGAKVALGIPTLLP